MNRRLSSNVGLTEVNPPTTLEGMHDINIKPARIIRQEGSSRGSSLAVLTIVYDLDELLQRFVELIGERGGGGHCFQ
jgi:hypothetical protein